jgi:signal transduction histidine kinase/ActR/RegA family two-component response regulator
MTVSLSTKWRLAIVAVGHLIGTTAIVATSPTMGVSSGVFGFGAVLVGAFVFGLRGGVAAAIVQALLNTLVMSSLLDPPVPFGWGAMVAIGFLLLTGYVVGNQRDLSGKLRVQLARNELLRVREQEILSAIPDAMIRLDSNGACSVRGSEASGGLSEALVLALGHPLPAEQQSTLMDLISLVRATGTAGSLTFDLPPSTSYDTRCLPTADASVLVVFRDVTDQQRLLRRVTSSENLASLGTLAAGLAHEVNNPLTYVLSSVYTVKLYLGDSEARVKADLDAALEGCWRIRDLVKNILETTTINRDTVEPVSVAEVVDAALALSRPQVRHRATLRWRPEQELHVMAHRTKLVQVVVNLVVNASQSFSDNRASSNEIQLRARREADEVVIDVTDNGKGMDEATRLRAIEPFFTTKEPGQGSGLGLFLCNSIVESLGGKLAIDSVPGEGTKVTVRLPAARVVRKTKPNPSQLGPMSADCVPQLRVLVVDDEPEIRRALDRILRGKHKVALCANGAEALERLIAGERFDVILCDLLMPEMTGIELFAEIDNHFRSQAERMVFMTGGATSEGSRQFIEEHSTRVVNKPFHPAEIEAAVVAHAQLPATTPGPVLLSKP